MSDDDKGSAAMLGSVAERPLGDPEIAVEILRLRVAELEEAIRRLAEQDATLSLLCKRDGSQVVTVTMDGTLTNEEKRAIRWAAEMMEVGSLPNSLNRDDARTLRSLLERLK